MEKIKEFLSFIGFGANEAEIYLTLLSLGTASVLDISKKVRIHRTNIYDALRKLVQKGVVFEINQPTRLYSARPLRSLTNYVRQKELELDELIKEHESRVMDKKDESKAKITKGSFALREALASFLQVGKPIAVFGIPAQAPEIIGPIIKDFHKERIKRKIPMRHIYNENPESVERAQYLNKMKYTQARILPSKYNSLATTNLSDDKVIFFLWNDITIIEIADAEVAKSYQNYFEILWSKAKVV